MAYKHAVIVTGGTAGMGYHAAMKIAQDNPEYLVVIASRSDRDRAADAINAALGQSNTAEELAHPPPQAIDMSGRKRYSTAKLCNVLWTYALARHLAEGEASGAPRRGITVTAMDPGLMPGTRLARNYTGVERWLWNRVLPRLIGLLRLLLMPNVHTPSESGRNLARMAVGDDVEGVTGKYFEGAKEIRSSVDSYDESKQEDLWEWTLNYVA